jgi:hypothetical protein
MPNGLEIERSPGYVLKDGEHCSAPLASHELTVEPELQPVLELAAEFPSSTVTKCAVETSRKRIR